MALVLTSRRALFVYYKVDPNDAQALKAATQAVQSQLALSHPGLIARLWVRGGASSGVEQTWMETYEHPQGVDDGLAFQIDQAVQRLPAGRIGPRCVEMFVGA